MIDPLFDPIFNLPLQKIQHVPDRKVSPSETQVQSPTVSQSSTQTQGGVVAGKTAEESGAEQKVFRDNGLISAITHAIFGRADEQLAPTDLQDRTRRRKQAGDQAAAFANSGGDSAEGFMQAPGSGGSGIGLQDIASAIRKIF